MDYLQDTLIINRVFSETAITDFAVTESPYARDSSENAPLPLVSYSKTTTNLAVNPSLQFSNSDIVLFGIEFLYVMAIALIMTDILKGYRKLIARFFRSLSSEYLLYRIVSDVSSRYSYLAIRGTLLISLFSGMMAVRVHDDFQLSFFSSFNGGVSIMLTVTVVVGAILLGNYIVMSIFSTRSSYAKMVAFDKLMLSVYATISLYALIAPILFFGDSLQMLLLLLVIPFVFVMLYHAVMLCKLFYKEKLSFSQYILYLCATKLLCAFFVIVLIVRLIR